jgi:hypothetical protein
MGLLPMAHMSPPQAVAENDNDKLLPLSGGARKPGAH